MKTQPAPALNHPCLPAHEFIAVLVDHLQTRWDGTLLLLDDREQFVAAVRCGDGQILAGHFRDPYGGLQAGLLALCVNVDGILMSIGGTDLVGAGEHVLRGAVHPRALVLAASRHSLPQHRIDAAVTALENDCLRLDPALDFSGCGLLPAEEALIATLQQAPCDLAQLCERGLLPAEGVRRLVYALLSMRVLRAAPATLRRSSGITERRASPRERFDSEPTLVVQLDATIATLISETRSLVPPDSGVARPSGSVSIRPSAAQVDSADTHLIVAEMLLQRGDARAAVLQAQKALRMGKLRPNQEALYAWLLYQRSGGGAYVPTCVWQHLASALGRDPNCDRAHYYQGLLHKRRGELALARRHLARALELNPGNADAECELILLDCAGDTARTRRIAASNE